jgi:hypothetical protein
MQIPMLEKEVKKYIGFNRYITKLRGFLDKIMGMKGGIILSTTAFLVVCILVFNVKVSQIIQKIPILSSVIDTKILEEFEAINEGDEFYQALMSDNNSAIAPESTIDTSQDKKTEGTNISNVPPENTTKPIFKDVPIPKAIQNILPAKAKIENMVVRNISPTEKLFKITLDNGITRYVQVKKESGMYEIVGK